MRQVPYERSKEFIDHYSPLRTDPILNKEYKLLKRRQIANANSSHDRKILKSKGENDAESGLKCYKSFVDDKNRFKKDSEFFSDENIYDHISGFNSCQNTLHSSAERGDNKNLQEGVDFGKIERSVAIKECMSGSDSTSIKEAQAVISCWLVLREQDLGSLVISALVTEGSRAGMLAEAEIGLSQLFDVKGIMTEELEADPSLLYTTCREILETVELRIENEHTRLVLSLSSSKFNVLNDRLYSEEASVEDAVSREPSIKEGGINVNSTAGKVLCSKNLSLCR